MKNSYLVNNDPALTKLIEGADKRGEKFSIDLGTWYNALAFEVQLKDVADFLFGVFCVDYADFARLVTVFKKPAENFFLIFM